MNLRLATGEDSTVWNEYLDKNPDASPYHNLAWSLSIEEAYGMRSYNLIAEDEFGTVVGILPAVLIKRPLGSPSLCSLPYCDRGEAIADTPKIEKQLIETAREIAVENKVGRYEYRGTQRYSEGSDSMPSAIPGQKVRMLLQLPESSAELLAGFKTKLRSQINKAKKNGLKVELANTAEKVNAFYHVFTQNMRDLGSPTHSLDWFQAISRNYKENCVIATVTHEDQVIGAGIVLIQRQTATIPWASTLRKYNRLAPNMLLYWSLLEYVTDHHCRWFDFGRSSYGEGTYKFKQQWGAKPLPLQWHDYLFHPNQDKSNDVVGAKSKRREQLEMIWRKLPLIVTITIGSRIRKYITL